MIDGKDVGVGSFDEKEGDDIDSVGVDGPVKSISPAVSNLIHKVVGFSFHDFN